jgi:ACDE family multidrug resistance protein
MKGKSIYVARVIYSISWFYLAPYIPYIIYKFNIQASLAGFVPFAFFIGSGTMQVPSAYLSTKIGLRNTLCLGLLTMSISSLAVGLSFTFFQLLVFYFIGGIGASMFFSSGGAIIAELNKNNLSRLMGLYNAAFSIGGIIGLNWIFFDKALSFTYASLLLSLLTLISLLINIKVPNVKPTWKTIRNRNVLYLGISTSGVWGIYYAIGELFPNFAFDFLHISIVESGEIASLLLFSSFVGGLLGFIGDKIGKLKGLIISSLIGIFPSLLLYTKFFIIGIIILGIFNELAISIMYSIVALEAKGANTGIGLAEVNSLNIILGTWLDPLATFIGFYSWITLVLISVIPLVLIRKIRMSI